MPNPSYNRPYMRWGKNIVAIVALATAACCAEQTGTTLLPCGKGTPGSPNCNPSKSELKQAKAAYAQGLKLEQSQQTEAAFNQFDRAAQLAPYNVEYVRSREIARQQMVSAHMERGNQELLKGEESKAVAEFRSALQLDPDNQFAQERLQDATGRSAPRVAEHPTVLADAGEIRAVPNTNLASFHYRGDSKALLGEIASVYGLTATIDDSVMSRHVRFDLGTADFYTAMTAACSVAHCFWSPLSQKQVVIAGDSTENRRRFERMVLRTFYLPGASTPQALNEIANLFRSVFEMRFVTVQPQEGAVEVRAPQRALDAATRVVEALGDTTPEVLLDIHVYQISHSVMRSFGLHIPNQFNLFNIPAAALVALGGQNIQDLINQLISSGGINQANSQAISGLLAQLGSQQNSIFSQPLATFGGGLTLFGLSLDTASVTASLNESSIRSLEHATLRVSHGKDGTLKIGSRYPILNASFAPIFNTPQIAGVIQNNSFTPAFPSFNYEDLGLTLKAKPLVSANRNVSLNVELELRSLGTVSLNGVPVISSREYKGSINLADGEPAVVAGSVSRTEQRSLTGIPGFGHVPLLNKVSANNSVQNSEDELLVVITPRVISAPEQESSAVWMAK
jgi:general secretion pathway protein D